MAKSDDNEPYRISAEQLFETTSNRKVIPCTLSADVSLGGGIPLGATVLIGGKFKSGKTTTCLQFGANAQKLYGSEVYIYPIEGRLTHLTMNQVQDLDKSKVQVVLPPAIFDKDENVIGHKKWTGQQWWNTIGENITNTKNAVHIIDSLSSLSSEKETSEGMGYQGRGDDKKLEAQFCRMYGDLIISNFNTVFFIAQLQANTSGYGPAMQIKAGNAIKHQADVILMCTSVEKWKEQDGRILGHDIIYKVECSALGPPHMEMKIPLRYGYGIDIIQDIVNHAITWNIIKRFGAWYVLPFKEGDETLEITEVPNNKDDTKGFVKVQGEHGNRNWFLVHPKEFKVLSNFIRNKIFGE